MNLKELQAHFNDLLTKAKTALKAGEMDEYKAFDAELDTVTEQIKALQKLEARQPIDTRVGLPLGADAPPADTKPTEAEIKAAHYESIYVSQFGDIDASQDLIMKEVYGQPYLPLIVQQDEEFKAYVRHGIEPSDQRLAKRQLWDVNDVKTMLKDGLYVVDIKATMVEGTGSLGGYAVPPQRAAAILSEAQGLVAVRQAGATVVQTSSNSIEWLKVTGAVKGSYPSALRGAWGGETQSPDATNLTWGLETIPVHLYTYKVPVSQSLLEDAANIMPILQRMMAETLAIDENIEFISGTGEKAPLGILPGNAPDPAITALGNVLTSGTSASFTITDYKSVRRQMASVYRMTGRAGYVFSTDTADHIETMQDSEGRFYFQSVGVGERTFGSPTRETEAMPDRASSSYPVIYGDMSGYAIVERLGLSIVRFQDSNTGLNVVEFHLRRRLGGRVVEPYRFAVLRCGA